MRIYLDHNATSPTPAVVQELLAKSAREFYGNPSSVHADGARARAALETARAQVADFLRVAAAQIVFTSGATEANNLVLRGVAERFAMGEEKSRAHFVTTRAEHPSLLVPLAQLATQGFSVTQIGVDCNGRIDLGELEVALRAETKLVTLLWANNETGVVQDLPTIAELVKARGILLHVDAVQAAGKFDLKLEHWPWDFLSFSGHKLGAAMGIGCLVMRPGVEIAPQLLGGTQERRRRAGTENLFGAISFGAACERLRRAQEREAAEWHMLREKLWQGIHTQITDVQRNGLLEETLCNTLSVTFIGVDSAVLLEALDLEGVAASAGSACASGSSEPSHVLQAMGRSVEDARATLRFSLGHGVDAQQIDHVTEILPKIVARIRNSLSDFKIDHRTVSHG